MVESIKKYEKVVQAHPKEFIKLFTWASLYAEHIGNVYFTSEYLRVEFRDRDGRTFVDVEPMTTFLEWAGKYDK